MKHDAELTFANGKQIVGWPATAIVIGFIVLVYALGVLTGYFIGTL